jgi:hypothetical protein
LRPTARIIGLLAAASMLATIGPVPAFAQVQTEYFESDVASAVKPWTSVNFYNDPQNFKFAIVSDRTGGMRPGVFGDAVKKLNLLMPEFVMSVGDFISGNTADRARLEKEWAEFDEELKPLKVPFFFVPGNHDINNDVMRDVWKQRSGVPFYSFVYKDVLFLALDTTGEKGGIIPEYQVEYMRQALKKHADARWTFVFMHHPLWLYENPAGFAKIEELLQGRRFTVIAGHFHRYLHEWRNSSNYYVLGTTGGGSELRGPRYGEFDHVTLITVTDDGPIMANLRLDGILPHDVTTRADYELTEALIRGTKLSYLLLTDSESAVSAGTLYFTFRNSAPKELQIKAQFMHDHDVRMHPQNLALIVPPKSEKVVEVILQSKEALPVQMPALLQLNWTMGFSENGKEDLFLNGVRSLPLKPSNVDLIETVAPEYVQSLTIATTRPDERFKLRYTMDGSAPTVASPEYVRPISVQEAAVFKARMFNDRGHASATSTQSYQRVPEGTGLRYRLYRGAWTKMPEFSELAPIFEGVATDLDVEARQMWPDNWGMVLEGEFQIDSAGEYTFYLNSDDGSKLYIDDELIIDNDGDHSLLELAGVAELSVGPHRIRIEYFEAGGEAILELDFEGPGIERQSFPVGNVTHQ